MSSTQEISSLSLQDFRRLRQRINAARSTVLLEPIVPRAADAHVPLSFTQERLWFLDRLGIVGAAYNVPLILRLHGELDVEALNHSFLELIRRHESLRTRFGLVEGKLSQIIASPPERFRIEILEMPAVRAAAPDGDVHRRLLELTRKPMDLTTGPLMRVSLVKLGPQQYILHLVLHHAISDGWSRGILYKELSALYRDFSAGRPASLPAPLIQFGDYAIWERQQLQGDALQAQLAYWKNRLADAPSIIDLPTDTRRSKVGSFGGGMVSFRFPQHLRSALRRLGQQQGVTLFMLLLAAFQILLARWSRQHDIVVGSPVANRQAREIEGVIGYFVNMVILRADLAADPEFTRFLDSVRDDTLGAHAHQSVPLEKLVEEFRLLRDFSHQPLFQTTLALQNTPEDPLDLGETQVEEMQVAINAARFDIELFVYDQPAELTGTFTYATDLFERSTIERMAGHFITLLAGIVADPHRRISRLPWLTQQERQQLAGWSQTGTENRGERCVHDLISQQAARAPHAVAVVCEGRQLTYEELEQRSNQLAHELLALGVGPESIVGLSVECSVEMVVAVLGIWKAGGAYLPLDPSVTPERLAHMLADAKPSVLVMQSVLEDALPRCSAKLLRLDEDWNRIARHPVEAPRGAVQVDNLAYVIYTSGSTDKLKAVMVEHGSLVNLLLSLTAEIGLDASDVLMGAASLSSDMSVADLCWPLLCGARLVLCPRAVAQDAVRLRKMLEAEITIMQATPTTWRMLLDAGWRAGKVRMICGAEMLTPDLAQALCAEGSTLWNLYGSTEATVWSTLQRIRSPAAASVIGRPLCNVQVHVLDEHMDAVAVGVIGDLYVGGEGLARGYCGQPALTAERFVAHPLQAGRRLYRTGDLARYLPDGTLEFHGRADHQVKVRGYRIELGKIEAALLEHPAVSQAAVMVREDDPGNRRIVAYVAGTQSITEETIANDLKARVPIYMVPDVYLVLDAFPQDCTGRIDRSALPVPAARSQAQVYEAPQSPLEEMLACLWSEILDTAQVGRNDNFFALGGNSLQALLVIARVQDSMGIEMSVGTLFDGPKLHEMASRIETIRRVREDAAAGESEALAPGETHGVI